MRYNIIRKMDIANGPGIRVSIFMQGCTFNCKNCFNKETHDFNGGKEFTDDTISKVLDLASESYIQGLSILGGEPLHPKNVEGTTKLAKEFKKRYPDKSIWIWSGYLYDEYICNLDITNYIDVVVDGRYEEDLHDLRLLYRGSSNQRVIDFIKSTKDKIVLYEGA